MTVGALAEKLGAKLLCGAEAAGREVADYYAGDLLSHVMGKLPEGACWFTVMNNANVAAVAALTDAACVVLCEGIAPDAALARKAESEGIALLSVPDTVCRAVVKAFK